MMARRCDRGIKVEAVRLASEAGVTDVEVERRLGIGPRVVERANATGRRTIGQPQKRAAA